MATMSPAPAASILAPAAVLTAIAVTYWPLAGRLVTQWATDDNYSHGFIVIPLASYFVWRRRAALAAARPAPSLWGVPILTAGLGLLAAGTAGAELFVARASLLPILAGAVLILYGPVHLRIAAFPLAFLLLMIPLPTLLFNQISMPLQLLASQVGETTLRTAGVAVIREGNVLELASVRLQVAEACSGIRSLVSLLTVGLTFGEIQGYSGRRLWLLALAAVPVAVIANAGRVAATGLAAHIWGAPALSGILHSTSGTLVFLAALLGLVAVDALARYSRPRSWVRA